MLARCSTMHSGRGMTETSNGRARRRGEAARGAGAVSHDPFDVLGLPTRPGLSDDDVRAAWRRIAAATHPDREDGGDPARFGAAAAAYAMLRTEFGRGEALADLGLGGTTVHRGRHAHGGGRPADPSVQPTGRHRAGRGAGAGRRTRVRPPALTRLRGWIARRATPHGRADAANPDQADAAGHGPGGGAAAKPVDAPRTGKETVPDSRRSRLMKDPGPGDSPGPCRQRDRWRLARWSAGRRRQRDRWPLAEWPPAHRRQRDRWRLAGWSPGRRRQPDRARRARWSSGWRVAAWRPDWRSARSRLGRRPVRRPGPSAFRVAGGAAMGVIAVVISGWSPGVVGVLVGVLTWLLVTAGHAFSRRRSR